MNIVSVHLKILRCLHHEMYSITDLSFILGIADFKIRKYIKDLEYILNVSGNLELCRMIREKSQEVNELKRFQSFLPEERKSYIILKFIHEDMLSLSKLSEELNVSRRTVVNDITALKSLLNQYDINIKSLPFQGIQLEGEECFKRMVFEIYILKNINSIKYLPSRLKDILEFVISLTELESITKMVKEIIKNVEYKPDGIELSRLHLLFAIALMRNNHFDESLEKFSYKDSCEIGTLLSQFLYLTNYEKKTITEYIDSKNFSNIIIKEKEIINKLKNIIKVVNKEFNTNIEEDIKFIMRLYGVFKCYEFKKRVNFNDFYLFNKNLSKKELQKFNKLKKILKNYFVEIDSYELIFIISIFIVEINKDISKRIEKIKDIIIVYRYLNPINLKELCYNLEIYDLVTEDKFVYINNLNNYLKNNKVEHIIIFQDLEILCENIIISRILLPITQNNKLNLKNIIKK